jgi:hypothetical protein
VSRIVVSLAKSIPEQDHRGDEVVAALRQTPDAQARCVLLSILGRIGSAATLPVLRDQLGAQEIEVRKAAVRALADWPEPTPLPDLFELAKASPDGAIRVLALRGYARQLALPSDRPIAETLAKFEQGLALAPNDAEKRLFLSGLAEIRHPRALEFVRPYIDQPALRDEALVAVTRLMQALDEGTLQATASHGAGAARSAFDGDRGTRWTSGGPQQKGQWFELDLGFPVEVQSITLDAGDTGDDYPRGYEVYLANTPGEWGEPAAQGVGKAKTTEIAVTPREARYIRIAQTGSTTGMYWSICELAVNGQARAGRGPNTPAAREGWVASASVKTEEAALVLDGDRDTRWGTWGPQSPGQWLMVDLAKELNVRRVIVDAAKSTKDIPAGYEVYVTSDTQDWGLPVAKGRGDEPLLSVPLLPKRGRYVKIIQTGTTDNWWWSVYELNVVAE